ncbi:hypothetical protein ACFVYC_19495 [Pseudarthrobacter sp. NPDC058329]|uniref:hypothetical protein n=1 Tax=Pseudarthrobacter sp. NPDC058329 TaxID=3346448 RepID=UPI0036DB8674
MDALVDAFVHDVKQIPGERFEIYRNGWEGQIGMALLDAVYSKQTQYRTKRGKGLLPRLLAFHGKHEPARSDLRELLKLSETELQDILGNGVTNGRTKASAALEAARKLVGAEVYTHEQYDHQNPSHRSAYLTVHGLGPVTHNYFGMLLGYPDTKPDTWIVRAVQRVADAEKLGLVVKPKLARTVVTEAHDITKLGKTVTHMDHAIWLTERARRPLDQE